jgi:hypothetical protein
LGRRDDGSLQGVGLTMKPGDVVIREIDILQGSLKEFGFRKVGVIEAYILKRAFREISFLKLRRAKNNALHIGGRKIRESEITAFEEEIKHPGFNPFAAQKIAPLEMKAAHVALREIDIEQRTMPEKHIPEVHVFKPYFREVNPLKNNGVYRQVPKSHFLGGSTFDEGIGKPLIFKISPRAFRTILKQRLLRGFHEISIDSLEAKYSQNPTLFLFQKQRVI